jgi:NADH:ubiquinone oxidoreductase subunit 5 (subunit L)/multisubunit Na+/H+ antiporter MnhA subunit
MLVENRIGDFGLSLGILALFYIFHLLEYSVIFTCVPLFTYYYTIGGFSSAITRWTTGALRVLLPNDELR